ncbi:unnamed protein product [Lactuca virosa]|uniref:Uncharacterized protein n=1 Tax=Lactuca virosa TaxID=75947 RepID=A0AAU9LZ30_9ASTR|nr:unnamed protein product [Lactuca virosa]
MEREMVHVDEFEKWEREFIWEAVDGHGMHLEAAHYMVDEAVDEELRYNKFRIMFLAVMNDITDKPDLKTVDLVFIPIVVDESYYLVCFCLKRVAFYIFDHIKRSGTIESAYGNRPQKLLLSLSE